MFIVTGSIFHVDGFPPRGSDRLSRGDNVNGVVMTSSPGPIPSAIMAICSASVPDETPDRVLHAEISGYFALELSHLFSWMNIPSRAPCVLPHRYHP